MCGLVAAFSIEARGGAPLAPDALAEPLAALAHRGPDGEGSWRSPDGRIALGHRRLAIIDRAGGAQPLINEDRTIVAIVSGEFYGHQAIRAALIARGHRFRTRSDSEILVHLYEERGIEAVHELRGEFALILWDARLRRGFAARDRFGIRPLLHARIDGVEWFASEAKALFAAGLRPRWDQGSVLAAAQMQYPRPDRTVFAGVEQIEPGELALIGDTVTRRRYWDLDYPRAPAPVDPRDAIAAVREAFDEAVRLRLDAEVPIAFQLSGGLDSTAVVASAAAQLGRPPVCFTVGFDRPGYDERHLAEASAAAIGAELRVIEVDPEAILDELPDAVTRAEGLAINGHIAAKHRLAKAIRDQGFGVVLTGEGSDEVFAGYAHLRADHYADGPEADAEAIAELRASNQASAGLMLADADGHGLALAGVRRALGYVPGWLAAKASLGARVGALLADEFVAAHAGEDAYVEFLAHVDVRGQLEGRARVSQSLYLWSKTALATYILRTLGDGIEMASSLEGRLPCLDHRLFELVRTLPVELLIRDGVEKWVLREAFSPALRGGAGAVPEPIRTRQKHPFLAPPLTLRSVTGRGPIADALAGPLPSFVDRRKLAAVLDRLPSMTEAERGAWDPALMLIASAAILQRSYGL